MSDVLKGNFITKKSVVVEEDQESVEDQFEREARKRLGGSIAFVAKRKIMWDEKEVLNPENKNDSGE